MKKRAITLLEVMIVILLIGLIGGVISYNLKGSLDKGKNFRSKEGAQKLEDILNLELQYSNLKAGDLVSAKPENIKNVIKIVEGSGLVSNPEQFVRDGWGEPYVIVPRAENSVEVWSTRSNDYEKEHSH
ncbi:MAG TPA: type II secretion system protein [Rhabdochlamydiaceae bacterium]|jgi:type II secretory pathway pseudopilin PulG|nr:type II secretion system protein [Rhabdochlamydiaceae bacterium]